MADEGNRSSIDAALADRHRQYRDFDQDEDDQSAAMASLGHPRSQDYRRLRDHFDQLACAANANARFVSYAAEDERSEYWGPRLCLGWDPTGLAGFAGVYPAHPRFGAYIEAAAQEGWPASTTPSLDAGQWIVATTSKALARALRNLAATLSQCITCEADNPGRLTIRLAGRDPVAAHDEVAALIAWHHGPSVLRTRTRPAAASDEADLPLAERAFGLGNVKRLTVTGRRVVAPLIPCGPGGEDLAAETAAGLQDLIRQGYPRSKVEHWLAKVT